MYSGYSKYKIVIFASTYMELDSILQYERDEYLLVFQLETSYWLPI